MFRVFQSKRFKKKLKKIEGSQIKRIIKFREVLKQQPFSGRPLGYKYIREKKFNGKRLLFLVFEQYKGIFLVTITNKKAQDDEIKNIRAMFQFYKNLVEEKIKSLQNRR